MLQNCGTLGTMRLDSDDQPEKSLSNSMAYAESTICKSYAIKNKLFFRNEKAIKKDFSTSVESEFQLDEHGVILYSNCRAKLQEARVRR
jgi:hypothetical protein